MENNRVSDGDVEMKSHREVMLDTIRPDLHVINNSERAISLKDDGPVTLKPNQAQEEASSKKTPTGVMLLQQSKAVQKCLNQILCKLIQLSTRRRKQRVLTRVQTIKGPDPSNYRDSDSGQKFLNSISAS
ncbi:unnamed protein product [Brassica rapa subsp. trilocularis]